MRTRFLGASIFLCLLTLPVHADVNIRAEYSATVDRLKPNPRSGIAMRQNFDVRLSGSNQVSENTSRRAGGTADNFQSQRVLGQTASDGGFLKWRVAGPNRLQRVVQYPQNVTTMTITTNGSSCTFDVQFQAKPGFSDYNFKMIEGGGLGTFTQPRVQSTSCSIR
jgi:hypothetical protein